jgi:CRP-like cAMP-binding protein
LLLLLNTMTDAHKGDLALYKNEITRSLAESLDQLDERQIRDISDAIEIRNYEAGSFLLQPGEKATHYYLILSGCVREYYLVDGKEKTTVFYTGGQGFTSFSGIAKEMPSRHFLQCVEDSTLGMISRKKKRELYKKYPEFERISRVSIRQIAAAWQESLVSYITNSPEKRYEALLSNQPELIERLPSQQIASHVGVKPESLNKIRKRVLSKKED